MNGTKKESGAIPQRGVGRLGEYLCALYLKAGEHVHKCLLAYQVRYMAAGPAEAPRLNILAYLPSTGGDIPFGNIEGRALRKGMKIPDPS